MIDEPLITAALNAFVSVAGVRFDADNLIDDTVMLSLAFPNQDDFLLAVMNTTKALEDLVAGNVSTSQLRYQLSDYQSYHYQHKVSQNQKADCRILFKRTDGSVDVLAFGHRFIPRDIYERVKQTRVGN